MRPIVLATCNPGKLREIRQVLADLPVEVVALEAFGQIDPPQEHGATFAENARAKAIAYARATGHWCLADDSGLCVDALDGAPGVQSARYAADRCLAGASGAEIDAANNAKLLAELSVANVPDEKRTAHFVCHLALSDGQRILIETFDTVAGHIAHQPRGANGFGYDPLFIINQTGYTAAELTPEKKNELSHRGKALRHFASLLKHFLQAETDSQ